jgi:hypothetical protein
MRLERSWRACGQTKGRLRQGDPNEEALLVIR